MPLTYQLDKDSMRLLEMTRRYIGKHATGVLCHSSARRNLSQRWDELSWPEPTCGAQVFSPTSLRPVALSGTSTIPPRGSSLTQRPDHQLRTHSELCLEFAGVPSPSGSILSACSYGIGMTIKYIKSYTNSADCARATSRARDHILSQRAPRSKSGHHSCL